VDALQIIADPRRREILRLVWRREQSAGRIASNFDVSFAAVSQHLKILRDAGFVTVRKEGRERVYRADRKALGPLRPMLEKMWAQSLDRLVTMIEEEAR
jgi:DNA-binding transcriptional ArsR family regulator